MSGPERVWIDFLAERGEGPRHDNPHEVSDQDEPYVSVASLTSEAAVDRAARVAYLSTAPKRERDTFGDEDCWDRALYTTRSNYRIRVRAAIAAAIGETDGKA